MRVNLVQQRRFSSRRGAGEASGSNDARRMLRDKRNILRDRLGGVLARTDDMAERTPGFETRAVHAGAAPDQTTGARITPIYQTTSYVFDDVDHAASLFNLQTYGYVY